MERINAILEREEEVLETLLFKLVATRLGLSVAQGYVDGLYGPGEWTRRKTEPVKATHYYFGEAEEFGPTYYWTRDL